MNLGRKLNVLFFGDQWDDTWRRRQELAARLAEREEVGNVIYVELPLTITSLLGYLLGKADRDAKKRWKRVLKRGLVARLDDVYVVTPISMLPRLSHRTLQAANARIQVWIERLLLWFLRARLRDETLVFWASHPSYTADLLGVYGEKLVCYDNSDHFSFIGPCLGASPPVMSVFVAGDRRLTDVSDLVFVNSELLYAEKRPVNPNTHLLLNAVRLDLFRDSLLQDQPVPPDIGSIRPPILGYVGYVGETTDTTLLERILNDHPEWSVVIIGGVDLEQPEVAGLRAFRNLHFLGEKPLSLLPLYIARFDVGLSLYEPCYLNDSRCSLKILNYLAMGKPVVATDTAGAHFFAEVIHVAHDAEQFLRCLQEALEHTGQADVTRRMEFVKDWTWENRAKQILDQMFDRLGEKNGSKRP
ncbi:MAG: glycosyltransferase [Chloroflexi bacterium]|nr:glycosyltransferase [Chloroflexota bacterium]